MKSKRMPGITMKNNNNNNDQKCERLKIADDKEKERTKILIRKQNGK